MLRSTLGRAILSHAGRGAKEPAIVAGAGLSIGWAELAARVDRLAQTLLVKFEGLDGPIAVALEQ